jgi:hypothetical protein
VNAAFDAEESEVDRQSFLCVNEVDPLFSARVVAQSG